MQALRAGVGHKASALALANPTELRRLAPRTNAMTEFSDAIDPKQVWRAIGPRAIGGAVVAACGAQGPSGFLALSATHLAPNPPTMLVTIGKATSALATVLQSKSFSINYFSTEQKRLADVFGGKTELKGANRF